MQTFLIERTISPLFDPSNPDQAALHSRWAVDAYQQVGAVWYGSVVAGGKMFGLVSAQDETAIGRYCEILGIAPADIVVRRVETLLGPTVAMPPNDPRFRPMRRP
jgi:hypothetical protein